MRCADGSRSSSAVVDIFDASSGKWTTAALSVARERLAATSLPNQGLAIFAGDEGLYFFHFVIDCEMCCVLCGGGSGRDAVGLQFERFEQPLRIADALCR
jgi:hypothetical protein